MIKRLQLSGLRGFYFLWLSQFISIFASRMTGFAITIWAWELTGSTTTLVLVGFTTFIPIAVLGPFAGTLVDRMDRKLVIAMSDAASALATGFLLVLFVTDRAQVLHLYIAGAFSGIFGALQYPADAAVISSMVPKQHLARANSMRSLIQSASGIGAPLLAGILLTWVGIQGILLIDLVTFLLAISALAFIVIPRPKPEPVLDPAKQGFQHDLAAGFRYVFERRSLLSLFILLVFVNISTGFEYPLVSPLILASRVTLATPTRRVDRVGVPDHIPRSWLKPALAPDSSPGKPGMEARLPSRLPRQADAKGQSRPARIGNHGAETGTPRLPGVLPPQPDTTAGEGRRCRRSPLQPSAPARMEAPN